MVVDFEKLIINRFQMSMNRELSFFLGLQVKQSNRGIFIHQEKYISELLKKYLMDTCASAKVPMGFGDKIFADPSGAAVDEKKYRGMIGSLLCLTASRPGIMFATCTNSLGIWYPANESFLLQAYLDSSYGGLQHDRKSTSGGCQFLGGRFGYRRNRTALHSLQPKQNTLLLPTVPLKFYE
ncbi:hypothetical protein Lser_V15G25003 [Lactuca serriola]